MPVAVAQPNIDHSDNSALIGALGIARDLFKVGMDEKQSKRAQELASKKIDAETQANILEKERQTRIDKETAEDRRINHLKDWRLAKEGESGGSSLPGYDGLYILRSEDARKEKNKIDQNEKDKPQKLTSAAALEIGDIFGTNATIDNLSKKWDEKASQSYSGIKSWIPTTDASNFDHDRQTAVQDIGKNLEGGKMTDKDRDNYLRMMPTPYDTKAQKEDKIAALKQVAKNKIENKLRALSAAKYDTGGFAEQLKIFDPPQSAVAGSSGESGTASAAPVPQFPVGIRQQDRSGIWRVKGSDGLWHEDKNQGPK